MATVALPGQVIGKTSTHSPGTGTHVSENTIYASLAGHITTASPASGSSKPTISVATSSSTSTSFTLPVVGSTILARILRVQQRQLIASILAVDSPSPTSSNITTLPAITDDETQFQAILRREDVRAFEKDKVVMNESFRVGDVVRAVVISLGDERSYYISTAGNEFGVVVARSEAGNPLVPVSWREMRDVITGKGETRKVAKPS